MSGLRIGLHYDPRVAAPGAEHLRALLEHAVRADALGIDVAWLAERPSEPSSPLVAALPVCAAVAARTRRLRVGTAVLALPVHEPLRVAEDAATLDVLSGGRFELGIGLGAGTEGAPSGGAAAAARAPRFENDVALLRRAWEGPLESHALRGEAGIEVWPKPLQPGGPPLWIGAGVARAQERAARLGAGLLLARGADPAAYLSAWKRAGRDPREARVGVQVGALPSDSSSARLRDSAVLCAPAAALALARRSLAAAADAGGIDLLFPAWPPGTDESESRAALEVLAGELAPALRAAA